MLVQASLCGTCWETPLLGFPRDGLFTEKTSFVVSYQLTMCSQRPREEYHRLASLDIEDRDCVINKVTDWLIKINIYK